MAGIKEDSALGASKRRFQVISSPRRQLDQAEPKPRRRDAARWVELRGHSDGDLEHRIQTLRAALQARAGTMLVIKWSALSAEPVHWASVMYQLP